MAGASPGAAAATARLLEDLVGIDAPDVGARDPAAEPAGFHPAPALAAFEQAADDAIAANPDVAQKVRDGKVAAVGALVGAVMKATRGQADAAAVKDILLQRLGSANAE